MAQALFSVITDQWQGIFGILLLITLGQTLVSLLLRVIFREQLTSSEYLAIGLAGWILPASLLSILWFLFGSKPSAPFSFLLLISLSAILIFFHLRLKPDPALASRSTGFFLLLCLLISIPLRLAFLSRALLPSYFDSARHYLLIKELAGDHSDGLITSLTTIYYHLGYHILSAFMVSAFQTEISKIMLILGQMVLAVLPLSVYFLVRHTTRSAGAGLFAVIVAAYGWYMPAHAVDWGKYPALISIGLMPFVWSLAYLLARNRETLSSQKRLALYLFLGAGILVSGFMHSRSLVVIAMAFLAWMISTWQQKLPKLQQAIVFFTVLAVFILEVIYIQDQAVLVLLFDPYIQKGLWGTALILCLSIFAQRHDPQFTFACLLAMVLFIGGLFIPVKDLVPGYANLTLLDRPFVEMILFLPLSLLGGVGLGGLLTSLRARWAKHTPIFEWGIPVLVVGLVLINALFTYDLYPSDCCVLAGHDDMAAMDWMNAQFPADARIGISVTELKVLASDAFEGYAGGDAGIWISPLIGRRVIPLPYDTNFNEQEALDMICQLSISHIFIGELGSNFDDSLLSAQPAWYKLLWSKPEVKIYEVVGCK